MHEETQRLQVDIDNRQASFQRERNILQAELSRMRAEHNERAESLARLEQSKTQHQADTARPQAEVGRRRQHQQMRKFDRQTHSHSDVTADNDHPVNHTHAHVISREDRVQTMPQNTSSNRRNTAARFQQVSMASQLSFPDQIKPTQETMAAKKSRYVSTSAKNDQGDAESTTDLSLSKFTHTYGAKRSEISKVTGNHKVASPESTVELSFMDRKEIDDLRFRIESKYRNSHGNLNRDEDNETKLTETQQTRTVQTNIDDSVQIPLQEDDHNTAISRGVRTQKTATSDSNDQPNITDRAIRRRLSDKITKSQVDDRTDISSHRRRGSAPAADEMTSAFILPDITVRVPQADHHNQSEGKHDAKNCTVCERSSSNNHGMQSSVKIPKPVPVSTLDLGPDATLRPSQPPQQALAKVLKQLQDEVDHLKLELAYNQAKLNQTRPALGYHSRKAITALVKDLIRDIDIKSDQIYALYDVLEGQKQAGVLDEPTMTEEEVNDTLRSIGIGEQIIQELTELRDGSQEKTTAEGRVETRVKAGSKKGMDMEEESDEELPWEGISDAE
jgi:hypothetical protein